MTRPGAHHHPEYWGKEEQHRFEDRVSFELREIRADLDKIATRVLMIFGGMALLAFIIPLVVPFVRDWLNITPQVIP